MKNAFSKLSKPAIYLLIITLFVIANFLVYQIAFRVDLSEHKAYSLSKGTQWVLAHLKKPVSIKVFLSSNLPQRIIPLKTDVLNFVDEYKIFGVINFKVEIIDPEKDAKAARQAQEYGIPQLQLSQVEKDNYAVSAIYFGIGLSLNDKREVIPQATNITSLEYDITSAIFKMEKGAKIKIGLVGLTPVLGQDQEEFMLLKKIVSQQFQLQDTNLSTASGKLSIDNAIKTLIVLADENTKYDRGQKQALERYLKSGGKIIVMADGVSVLETFATVPAQHNLFDFFEKFGVVLNKDLVLSDSSEIASFTNGESTVITAYPFWVKTTNFNQNLPKLSTINSLLFPWVSSVSVDKNANTKTNTVIKTEPSSWHQSGEFKLLPNQIETPSEGKTQSYNLVTEIATGTKGKLMLIATSNFVKDQFLQQSGGNLDFFVNTINEYVSDGALSGIRSRAISIAPLVDWPEKSKEMIKYLNILLLPGFFAFFGMYRLLKRR